jgi:hypothetical protein
MRLFGRPTLTPRLTGAVAFLAHLPNVVEELGATRFFSGLGGFAFTLALDDAFRAMGRPGTFYTADYGNKVVYLADGFVLDHTGISSVVPQEPVTAERVAKMAIGPDYARPETLQRDRRWAARLIATAQTRAEAGEPVAAPVAKLAA